MKNVVYKIKLIQIICLAIMLINCFSNTKNFKFNKSKHLKTNLKYKLLNNKNNNSNFKVKKIHSKMRKFKNAYFPNYVSSFYGAHRNLLDENSFKRMNDYSSEHKNEIIFNHNEKFTKMYSKSKLTNQKVASAIIKD